MLSYLFKGTGPGKIFELRRRTFERTVMFGDSCQVGAGSLWLTNVSLPVVS